MCDDGWRESVSVMNKTERLGGLVDVKLCHAHAFNLPSHTHTHGIVIIWVLTNTRAHKGLANVKEQGILLCV